MKEIRIGLVGAGWMGNAHTNAFANALMLFGVESGKPVFEVVADVNLEAAKTACKKLGFSRWAESWQEVVTDPNVDVVDIATPNAFHYEVAKAALENGKHVYCEKPLTLSAEQSKELAELAKQKGVVNYVGYNNVMNPANAYIKELVSSGKLGEIMRFSGTYDQDGLLDPTLPITWRHINKHSGSGALGDLGSHLLSISQFILGDITSVNALSKIVIPQRPKQAGSSELAEVENDDLITILAEYENGAIGTIGASRVATGRKNYLTFEIQGTEGSVYYSLERMNEVNVYFTSDNSADRGFRNVFLGPDHKGYSAFYPASGIAIGYNDMKVLEAHELLAAITEGKSYACDFEFGWKIDRTVSAILKSAAERKWVEVEEKTVEII
ncbi:Gfo/Idh/MocA family protein [Metabacillus litoralis]|jgi:predicted dehydrogenase|uniref:Gfo/Idh/MocA family protein n=1 Tax=Metabacillus litoralis TaxID=152268 RepID=UPI0020423EB0|nr:Gfo/Idh/MocA family oxidoreductase [Metabacillus litoralis]MCM3654398.1 Gfo/Idh/MocA family oxidoreductase [Metabacillus litoralis]